MDAFYTEASESGRAKRRRRDKQHKKDKSYGKKVAEQSTTVSPEALLDAARVALGAACEMMVEEEVEFVGCVLSRVPKGVKSPGEFKIWVDREVGIDADLLAEVSHRLRDALRDTVPGRPAISVLTPGRRRPLFCADDFERFRGLRAQLTLRHPDPDVAGGRRKLVGELLGIDAGEVIIQDEAADDVLRAPLASLQLGEKTALAPRNADSGPLKFSKPQRGGKTAGAAAAAAAVAEELTVAPVTVFLKSYCPYCRRALKLLRETLSLEPGDASGRLHVVALENREDMVALQQHLRERTGAGTVPRIFFGTNGWVGGAEELEALAEFGPGPLAARLMEAVDEHERRAAIDRISRGQAC